MRRDTLRGPTLSELTVILVTVAVLLAIGSISLQRVRIRSYRNTCTGNLTRIYQAMRLYEQDNGFLPFNPFDSELKPYNVQPSWFICPANQGRLDRPTLCAPGDTSPPPLRSTLTFLSTTSRSCLGALTTDISAQGDALCPRPTVMPA